MHSTLEIQPLYERYLVYFISVYMCTRSAIYLVRLKRVYVCTYQSSKVNGLETADEVNVLCGVQATVAIDHGYINVQVSFPLTVVPSQRPNHSLFDTCHYGQ